MPSKPTADPYEDFAINIQDVLEEITYAHETLSDPDAFVLTPSERGSIYDALDQRMKLTREDLEKASAPTDLIGTKNAFVRLLVKERDIWVHMSLFARTGQEVHRVLANELLSDIQQEIPIAVSVLVDTLQSVDLDPTDFDLEHSVPTVIVDGPRLSTPVPMAPPTAIVAPTNTTH